MKNLLSLAILLCLAKAQAVAIKIPEHIVCRSNSDSSAVRNFELKNLNSKNPYSTIEDSGFMNSSVSDGVYQVGFSNECDNTYEISLSVDDLSSLDSGEVSEIKGSISYSDQNSESSADGVADETIEISCKK